MLITIPEMIRPIIVAPLLATGPTKPDVEALLLNTNSKYFGRNWINPTKASNENTFEAKLNK